MTVNSGVFRQAVRQVRLRINRPDYQDEQNKKVKTKEEKHSDGDSGAVVL